MNINFKIKQDWLISIAALIIENQKHYDSHILNTQLEGKIKREKLSKKFVLFTLKEKLEWEGLDYFYGENYTLENAVESHIIEATEFVRKFNWSK